MTYDQARDREQLGKLEPAIGLFINRSNLSPPRQNRQTVILFPGGLGSQLVGSGRIARPCRWRSRPQHQ